MERRLFYTAPTLDIAEQCQSLVRELNIADDNFSVFSLNSAALRSRKLRPADYLKSMDLTRCSLQGLALGFAGGLVLLILLKILQPYGLDVPTTYYWAPVLLATCFGFWAGIMTGVAKVNHNLEPFMKKLDDGGSIVMIDITQGRELEIKTAFEERIPSARLERITDLNEPVFQNMGRQHLR